MGANVGSLAVSLGLDAAQYTEGLTKADVQAQQFAQQQTRTQASIDRTVASLAKQAQQIGLTTREIKLQQLAAKGASDAQISSADASLRALEAAQAAAAKHAKELREAEGATEGFSLASHAAQRELVVLAHELSQGNVKKFGSSLLVLAETTGAAGLLFSGMAVAVAGAAAVVGSFAFAAVKGAEESHALARAIEETGNVAGLTEGKFNDLAAAQAKQTNSSIGASRDLLQSLAASGRFSGEALTAAGTAAAYFAKATGQSTDEVGKEFVGLADDVVGGADRMNRQYHFLDATQLQYIKTLHEQGDEQKAFIVTADALAERLKGVSTNLGTLESAWQKIKNAASGAWDSMLNVGRSETVEEKLATVTKQIEAARSGSFYQGSSPSSLPPSIYTPQPAASRPASIYDIAAPSLAQAQSIYGSQDEADLRTRQASLQDELKLTNHIAEAQAAKVRQDEAEIAVMHLKEGSLTKQEKLTRDLANANAIFDRAGRAQNDPERQQVLADIRQKAFPSNPQKSTLDLDVARIKASAAAEEDIYRTSNSVFSALRSAGLIDDEHYYAEKLFLLQANAQAEEKALTDEIARRRIQTFTGEGAADKANENAKAITEAEAKLAKVRKDAAAQETVLGIESDAASRRRAAGYLAEELAAEQSLEATKRSHAEEIALVGVGGEARIQSQAHSQITDRYKSEIDRANADIAAKRAAAGGTATADDEATYATRIALLQKYQALSLSEWDAYYAKLKATEEDATLGYQKGLADYATSIGSLTDRVAKETTGVFKGLEDALVSFATTGKLSFKSLEQSIIASFLRIAIQESLLKPLTAYLGGGSAGGGSGGGIGRLVGGFLGLFGGAGTGAGAASAASTASTAVLPGLATGGRALPGGLYPVTERGPEVLDVNGKHYLMTGNRRANVTPVSSSGNGGSQRPIQIDLHFPPGTTKETATQAAARAGQAVRKAIARS